MDSRDIPGGLKNHALDSRLINSDSYESLGAKESLLSILGHCVLRGGSDTSFILEKDPYNQYSLNSYGYRDPEYAIHETPELLAAGCSQTFGQGVPEDGRWSYMLGQKLGLSTRTLAIPGWSTQTIVSSVMHHIKTYGKPKVIALLLPDFFRLTLITNTRKLVFGEVDSKEYVNSSEVKLNYGHVNADWSTPRLAKKPFNATEVLNVENSFYFGGQSIVSLVDYCAAAGIDIVWATWDFSVHVVVDKIRQGMGASYEWMDSLNIPRELAPYVDLSSYVDLDFYHSDIDLDRLSNENCHSDLKDKFEGVFDLGTDSDRHMGVHLHAHISDRFYEALSA